MTRITSRKTRQAVLVTGEPLDPLELPELIQLFNEQGEPLMLGGVYFRNTHEITTAPLEPGERGNHTLALYPSVRIFKITTSVPARVRVYSTLAHLLADDERGVGVRPRGNHGRLLEVVTEDAYLDLILSPAVDMTSIAAGDGNFYANVTNLDDAETAIDITYHYFRTE